MASNIRSPHLNHYTTPSPPLQIEIDDCNDEPPIFEKDTYTWTVSEYASINTVLNSGNPMYATDADEASSVNSQVSKTMKTGFYGVIFVKSRYFLFKMRANF